MIFFQLKIHTFLTGFQRTLEKGNNRKKSFLCLIADIYLKCDTNGQLSTRLHNERDDFNFAFINFPYLAIVR